MEYVLKVPPGAEKEISVETSPGRARASRVSSARSGTASFSFQPDRLRLMKPAHACRSFRRSSLMFSEPGGRASLLRGPYEMGSWWPSRPAPGSERDRRVNSRHLQIMTGWGFLTSVGGQLEHYFCSAPSKFALNKKVQVPKTDVLYSNFSKIILIIKLKILS